MKQTNKQTKIMHEPNEKFNKTKQTNKKKSTGVAIISDKIKFKMKASQETIVTT